METRFAKDSLKKIFQAGINAVNGKNCVARFLAQHPISQPIYLIAIGKAAASMAQGALAAYPDQIKTGLVITKKNHCLKLPFTCFEASHPIPDASSVEAGKLLLQFIKATPQDALLLFLISGGTSALVEVLPENFSLTDLRKLNQQLIASHLPIAEINKIRAQHSLIKGGGLIKFLAGRQAMQLLISDVPSNHPEEIGSGLLFLPNPQQKESTIKSYIIASIFNAMQAAADYAKQLGYKVETKLELITGDPEAAGKQLAQKLLNDPARIMICGGETSIALPEHPGLGGRNQHLALSAATVLAGHKNVYLLAAGTDGTDGPNECAGAIVDGQTIQRGERKKLDPQLTLKKADSGTFLQAAGDLFYTGPTHTNVMDLIVGLKLP